MGVRYFLEEMESDGMYVSAWIYFREIERTCLLAIVHGCVINTQSLQLKLVH